MTSCSSSTLQQHQCPCSKTNKHPAPAPSRHSWNILNQYCGTVAQDSWGTILWSTVLGHSCKTLFNDTTPYRGTLVKLLNPFFETAWGDTFPGHSCKVVFWESRATVQGSFLRHSSAIWDTLSNTQVLANCCGAQAEWHVAPVFVALSLRHLEITYQIKMSQYI